MRRTALFTATLLIGLPLVAIIAGAVSPQTPKDTIDANTVECRRLIIASPGSPGRIEAVAYKGVTGLYLTSGDETIALLVKAKGEPQIEMSSKLPARPIIRLDKDGLTIHDLIHGPRKIPIDELWKLAK